MKKIIAFVSICLLTGLYVTAEYETIERSGEFDVKVDDFEYSLVCIANSKSDAGKQAKSALKDLSEQGDFDELLEDRIGFLFIRADRSKNDSLVHEYAYHDHPVFMLFKSDAKITEKRFDADVSWQDLQKFMRDEIGDELQDIKDELREEKRRAKSSSAYTPGSRVYIGLGTGYYPGHAYVWKSHHHPYWWHRRYVSRPYYRGYHRHGGYRRGGYHRHHKRR